jgi:hypothetical protein
VNLSGSGWGPLPFFYKHHNELFCSWKLDLWLWQWWLIFWNVTLCKCSSPVTGLGWPTGFQQVKVPRFHDNGTGRWYGSQSYAPAAFTPRKSSWYSFLLEAELTPGPKCDWKEYVKEKFQWHHLGSNQRPSGL